MSVPVIFYIKYKYKWQGGLQIAPSYRSWLMWLTRPQPTFSWGRYQSGWWWCPGVWSTARHCRLPPLPGGDVCSRCPCCTTWSPSPRCGGNTCTAYRRAPPHSLRPTHRGGSGRYYGGRTASWRDWTPRRTWGPADPWVLCPPWLEVPHCPGLPTTTNHQSSVSKNINRGRSCLQSTPPASSADWRQSNTKVRIEIFFWTCCTDWWCLYT